MRHSKLFMLQMGANDILFYDLGCTRELAWRALVQAKGVPCPNRAKREG